MLQSLFIKNYAIINKLEIDFKNGLNIITGETGAGKSILLGAMSLILGQRADTNVLKKQDEKCVVEGHFFVKPYSLEKLYDEHELDYDENTVIRREILPNGKSRAFINDLPVNLQQLKELGSRLIDIHAQHQNLNLNSHRFQTSVIDIFAHQQEAVLEYKKVFEKYNVIKTELEFLINQLQNLKQEQEYVQFQFEELDKAGLRTGEMEELEKEHFSLTHAEEIKIIFSQVNYLLSDEGAVLNKLKQSIDSISKLHSSFNGSEELKNRLNSAYIELKDVSSEIESVNERVELDPQRLQLVSDRLDLIYALQQKHKKNNVEELIALKDQYQAKLDSLFYNDEKISSLKKELTYIEDEIKNRATALSDSRRKVIPDFEKRIINILMELGIPSAKFNVSQEKYSEYTSTGIDKLDFLFTANKETAVQEISKTASGGEISRLMLGIKSLIVDSMNLPTIIFDEIDTGVSGEIADKVGGIIKEMSTSMQILNITHLPQVASKGDYHYLVHKTETDDSSETKVRLLTHEERIQEIAKMLSGEEITEAAILNAKELLKN